MVTGVQRRRTPSTWTPDSEIPGDSNGLDLGVLVDVPLGIGDQWELAMISTLQHIEETIARTCTHWSSNG